MKKFSVNVEHYKKIIKAWREQKHLKKEEWMAKVLSIWKDRGE